jgi:serine protease inhibitor
MCITGVITAIACITIACIAIACIAIACITVTTTVIGDSLDDFEHGKARANFGRGLFTAVRLCEN